ncbi:DEKNAAC103612 [Brettanomyces naardenensis]|uniref:tRNA pseudouridine synthase 1 n=1 Tax=Brettanomyces naardenensis TaxID=13370 RepID=A0A448YMY1_BRENA|nr:DEKNAAC103612 [Brettanomyces naardenensis]
MDQTKNGLKEVEDASNESVHKVEPVVVENGYDDEEGGRTDPSNRWLRTRKSDGDGRIDKRQKLEDNKDNRALTPDGKPMFPEEKRLPKRKVACMIGYCGAGYHGMQINPLTKTIEGELFEAMVKAGAISMNNSNDLKKSGFMRAARTDKGVHAAGNMISLKMIIEDDGIIDKINAELPEQIRVWGFQRVNKSFDCRKMCSSRVYEYLMPTYSLLPPRLNSPLSKLVKEMQRKYPDSTRTDPEGEKFWEELTQKISDAGISQFELDQINEANREDIPLTIPLEIAARKVKDLSLEARQKFRVKQETLDALRKALSFYLGSHNFHNFTNGKPYRDPSAFRFMKDITISDPFVIGKTEWISIKIHGQSFMLHQIRKMIGLASLVVRAGCPVEKVKEAFGPAKVNIPKAPALGLLLERPVYDGYNQKLKTYGHEPLNFDKYSEKMDAFKRKYIYSKIYEAEESEHTFHGFFGFIDFFTGNDSSNNGKPIFEFITEGEVNKEGDVKEKKENPAADNEAVEIKVAYPSVADEVADATETAQTSPPAL